MKIDYPNYSLIFGSFSALAVGLLVIYLFKRSRKTKLVLLQDADIKYTVTLIDKQQISWNSRLFRYSLPTKDHVLGLPTGQHLFLSENIDGKLVIRPYTPVTSDDCKGHFDLVIKIYFKDQHPKYPEGGKLSQYLDNMKIGDKIQVRGPSGNLIYKGNGNLLIRKNKTSPSVSFNYKKIGMIAGGTGITPMLQLIRAIIKNPKDKTQIWLLFANQKEEDILLREELEEAQRNHPEKVHIWYTIETSESSWNYSVGFVNDQMIKDHLPPPADDTIIIMCGPPPMINLACTPNLDRLGYSPIARFIY